MIRKVSLLIALAIIFITSCKKYPDGPLINFESKEKRVLGIWWVNYFSIDGADSTAYLKSKPYYGCYIIYPEIVGGGKEFGYSLMDNAGPNPNPNYNGAGYWMFLDHKKSIYFHFYSYVQGACGPYRANDVTWRIMRLEDTDLWLKTTYNGKEYFVKFKH